MCGQRRREPAFLVSFLLLFIHFVISVDNSVILAACFVLLCASGLLFGMLLSSLSVQFLAHFLEFLDEAVLGLLYLLIIFFLVFEQLLEAFDIFFDGVDLLLVCLVTDFLERFLILEDQSLSFIDGLDLFLSLLVFLCMSFR